MNYRLLVKCIVILIMAMPRLSADASDLSGELDGFFAGALNRYRVPGLSIAIVKDGTVIHQQGYGVASFQPKRLMDAEQTLFQVNSISKVVTTAVILRQVDRGLLKLDDPIRKWLPELQGSEKFALPITVAHLLSHSSGLDLRYLYWVTRSRDEHMSNAEVISRSPPRQTIEPGKLYLYNNLNLIIAGRISELVANKGFAQLAQEEIFTPLQMTSTSLVDPQDMARVSNAYAFRNFRFLEFPFRYLHGSATASVITTASDMAKFVSFLVNQGRFQGQQLLREATAKLFFRDHFTIDRSLAGHSLGFERTQFNGRDIFKRRGMLLGAQSELTIVPDEALGIFLAHNGHDGALTDAVRKKILTHFLPQFSNTPVATRSSDKVFSVSSGVFAEMTHSRHYIDRLALMLRPKQFFDVEVEQDQIRFDKVNYSAIGSGIYRAKDGQWLKVMPDIAGNEQIFYHQLTPYGKVSWWEDNFNHKIVLIIISAISFLFLLGFVIWLAYCRLNQRKLVLANKIVLGSLSLAALNIIFIVDFWHIVTGLSPIQLTMLTAGDFWLTIGCANASVLLLLGCLGLIVGQLSAAKLTRFQAACRILLLLPYGVLILLWDYWNILGWRI